MDQSDRDNPAPDGLAPFEMCLLDIRGWKLCPGWTQSQLGMLRMLREVRVASVAVPVPGMWELRSANCAMVPSFAEHVLDVALAEADAEGIRLSNSSSDLSPNLTVSSATRNRFQ